MANSISKLEFPTPALFAELAWELLIVKCCQFTGSVASPFFGLQPSEERQVFLHLVSTHVNRRHGRLMSAAHAWARLLKGLRERLFWRLLERSV